jgi:N-acetylmuramoyl-L-alanine amidase
VKGSERVIRLVLVGLIVVAGIVGVTRLFSSSSHAGGSRGGGSSQTTTSRPTGTTALPTAGSGGGTALDTSLFAPGSCMAFPPTHGNRHLTVFLDAGHGGVDPGGVGATSSGQSVYEKNLTLPVELDATKLLRAVGFRVVDSRTNGGPVSIPRAGDLSQGVYTTEGAHAEVAARDICANLGKANVLIGIYFDAGPSPQNAGSITSYDADRPFAAANKRLADLLQHDVLAAMNTQGWQIPDGGVNLDIYEGGPALTTAAANYDHLMLLGPAKAGFFATPSTMPGAVIEPLFATDPFEATIAVSHKGQEVIAGGIVQTIEQFFAAKS